MPRTLIGKQGSCTGSAACTDPFQGDEEHEAEVGGQLNGVTMGTDHCFGKWQYTLLSKSVWVGFIFLLELSGKMVYQKQADGTKSYS